MSSLNQRQYTHLIQLVALLRQFGQAHPDLLEDTNTRRSTRPRNSTSYSTPTDRFDDSDQDSELDSDSEDDTALNVSPAYHEHANADDEIRVSRRRRIQLLNALSFAASPESKPQFVTAMAMEISDDQRSVCFRVAMNGAVPAEVIGGLRSLGNLLQDIKTGSYTS